MPVEIQEQAAHIAEHLLEWQKTQRWEATGEFAEPGGPIDRKLSSLLTGNGMLEIIEALRKRHLFPRIDIIHTGQWAVWITGPTAIYEPQLDDSLPTAVLKSAYQALTQEPWGIFVGKDEKAEH